MPQELKNLIIKNNKTILFVDIKNYKEYIVPIRYKHSLKSKKLWNRLDHLISTWTEDYENEEVKIVLIKGTSQELLTKLKKSSLQPEIYRPWDTCFFKSVCVNWRKNRAHTKFGEERQILKLNKDQYLEREN